MMGYEGLGATGDGLATIAANEAILDTWYPAPKLIARSGPSGMQTLGSEEVAAFLGTESAQCLEPDAGRAVNIIPVRTHVAHLAMAPIDAHDVYLRLHLLSHRLIRPNEANLDGLFVLLTNVA